MTVIDAALLGSMWAGGLGLITLVCSRIRCIYRRGEEGCQGCICGCTDKSIQQDHEEVEVHSIEIGGTDAVLLLPKK